jgi:SsrA-binding protein
MAKREGEPGTERSLCRNRKARHQVHIEDRIEAGLALVGSEVKSCRAGRAAIEEAYVQVEAGQAFLVNARIDEYVAANRFNHEPRRKRKLLLHRREIDRLEVRLRQQGQTAVPLSLYLKGGRVKLEIGVGKGKTFEDRRDTVRERESRREMERAVRRRR